MDIWYFIYMSLNKYFDIVALEKSSYLEEKKIATLVSFLSRSCKGWSKFTYRKNFE